MTIPQKISVFQALKHHMGDALPTVNLTKATLVHMSHTLENFVLELHLPALIFTGFQESSHWRKETRRYRELSEIAMQVCIFAGKPLPEEENVSALQVTLAESDQLQQEWFLAILSTDFTVVLAGLDNMETPDVEAYRRFETIWSFDVDIVNGVLDVLEGVIEHYRPKMLSPLREARRNYPPIEPKSEIVVRFTRELLRFEDKLQREIYAKAEALRVSQAYYRSLVSHAPVALLSVSTNGTIQLIDDNSPRAIFANMDIDVGSSVTSLGAFLPSAMAWFQQTLTGNAVQDVIEVNNGMFEVRTRPIVDQDDLPQSVLIIFIDITERHQEEQSRIAQERLLLQLEKETEVNELRRQLMITLSHELRTPLASIRTSSDLLIRYFDRLESNERENRLLNIQRQITHLVNILNDIDAIVRRESAPLGEQTAPLDLQELLTEIIQEVEDNSKRSVKLAIPNGIGLPILDPRVIRYIVTNLLSNAAKYSEAGTEILLEARQQGANIVIQVTDHGIGIPPEEIDAVTQSFFRASNVGVIGGTGLGMSIIHNTVQAMGGTLNVQSTLGVGTAVNVSLPVSFEEKG